MATNDKIRKKLEKRLHDEFLVPPLLFVQLEALVDKQARSDTAKEIFKRVDACWKDIGLGHQGFDWDEYTDIKKEYKVD